MYICKLYIYIYIYKTHLNQSISTVRMTFNGFDNGKKDEEKRMCHSLSPSALCFPAHIWFSCTSFLSSLVY